MKCSSHGCPAVRQRASVPASQRCHSWHSSGHSWGHCNARLQSPWQTCVEPLQRTLCAAALLYHMPSIDHSAYKPCASLVTRPQTALGPGYFWSPFFSSVLSTCSSARVQPLNVLA